MAHYKNRRPKSTKGHCGLCALHDHHGGLRNKRIPTMQERRAAALEAEQVLHFSDPALVCHPTCGDEYICDWCLSYEDPMDGTPRGLDLAPPVRVRFPL